MRIIRAAELGMCFGVRDALQIAAEVADPALVTIHGELVHNPAVIRQLDEAGFHQSSENDRTSCPPTPLVLITAHGVSNRERDRLQSEGKGVLDTTCPLVRRVHGAALELAHEKRHVLLIGKPGHVEVRGIVEDLDSFDVVVNAQAVRDYQQTRLGVVCQTTMPTEIVDEVLVEIKNRNPTANIRFVDTVCHPTKRRQQAMLDLIKLVDAVVVVGGQNSNNTKRLVQLCEKHCTPALHVTNADEVDPKWIGNAKTIGLTAGTSTLDETIDEVHARLEQIASERRH